MTSLRDKAGRALAWDLLGNYGGQISSFVISIFLARLLEPVEFGLVGMSMVFISILRVFMDMGFASALIQNKNNSSLVYSSVFYLNIAGGTLLTLLIFLTAPLIGDFYQNQKVTLLVKLLSITFFISAFNIVQESILKRSLNFKVLTFRDLGAQIVAGIVAIAFAYYGFGVYSLVIQQIIAAIIKTILLWNLSEWYPKREFSFFELRKLTGFSLYAFAAQSMNQIIIQMDTLIIGKLFSPATLGFFSRANSLNEMINKNSVRSISKVFFPALATIQDDDLRFEKVFLKIINIVSALSIFLTGVFFLIGEEIILLLFGEKWEPSVFIFQILIIKGFTYPISAMIVNAFMAKGKSKENFHYGNIRKVLQLSPFLIAYFYGFEPYLYALLGVSIIAWLLNNFFVSYSLKISFKKQVKAVVPNLITSLVIILGILYIAPSERNLLWAFIKGFSFSILFITWLWLSKSELFLEGKLYYQSIKYKAFKKNHE